MATIIKMDPRGSNCFVKYTEFTNLNGWSVYISLLARPRQNLFQPTTAFTTSVWFNDSVSCHYLPSILTVFSSFHGAKIPANVSKG